MTAGKTIRAYSLVLYKKRPARVLIVDDKGGPIRLEIELEGGDQVKVRTKDITLLHPGPLQSLSELQPQEGEVEIAWEILCEEENRGRPSHDLVELAELIYGEYTPATAWAAYQWLQDGLYFYGTPEALEACSPEEVAYEQAARQERLAETQAWDDFLARVRRGEISPQEDSYYLREVEDLALGRREDSRVLRELGRAERPQVAHAMLLELGYWNYSNDPYPIRLGLQTVPPTVILSPLSDEPRTDLTHLATFAIDDRGNRDPDDALSLESIQSDEDGRFLSARIWVHVADVATLVSPGSKVDLEARARGATLYLPEKMVPMLPPEAVSALGLGLQEVSPALSFGLELNAEGDIVDVQVLPSWVQVQRLTYETAEDRLDEEPLRNLYQVAQAYQVRRQRQGALFIDLPETIVRVKGEKVVIRPVLRLRSRDLVREAMLMAGEAAARFVVHHHIPFPFVTQEATGAMALQTSSASSPGSPDMFTSAEESPWGQPVRSASLAAFFAVRRTLKPSQVSSHPAPHAGVGLPVYSRVTSPLRRYLDLVAHQQLRAHLRGQMLLGEQDMLERVGTSQAVLESVNRAEGLARRHWTLVYLLQHPQWSGEGVLVDRNGLRGKVIIPELALETRVHLRQEIPLDSRVQLSLRGISLAELEAHFQVIN